MKLFSKLKIHLIPLVIRFAVARWRVKITLITHIGCGSAYSNMGGCYQAIAKAIREGITPPRNACYRKLAAVFAE
jgi:hypothetical protein